MIEANHTEIMKDWEFKRIGDVCFPPQYGWTTSSVTEGKIKLLRTTDITSGIIDWQRVPYCKEEPPQIDKYLLHEGDIVISRAGSVGYSILINNPETSVFASYLIRFTPKPIVNNRYFAFFLQSPAYWQAISEKSLGIAIPNVNASKIKDIIVPIAPLLEQSRIVAKIEELFSQLDAAEAALKRAKANLKRYRQAVLQAAVTGELTREWREAHAGEIEPASVLLERIRAERKAKWEYEIRAKGKDPAKEKYVEPQGLDVSQLPELPEGWVWTSLSMITTSMKNGIYKPHEYYSDDGIACLRMYNIENGSIVMKDIKRMKLSPDEIEEYELLSGDILVNRVNSRELVGKSARIPEGLEKCVFESKNIRLRLDKLTANSAYANICLQRYGREYFTFNAQQVVGMASINQDQLGAMIIPLPPIVEQIQISIEYEELMTMITELESAFLSAFTLISRLRQSILQRAFSGQLHTQDVNP